MPQPSDRPAAPLMSDVFEAASVWQMSLGERAAFIGLLQQLRPSLAIEIGTAEGGSLRQLAAGCPEVHSFDLVPPQIDVPDHVQLHLGDSHVLLPELLQQLSDSGRTVDFALVDGDHSTAGVARDIDDLLASPAGSRTVIVMHDSLNPVVRAGLESVDYDAYPAVVHVDLDWVPGRVFAPPLEGQLWSGLGLIVTDAAHPRPAGGSALQTKHRSSLEEILRGRAAVQALTAPPAAASAGRLARVRSRLRPR